MNATTMDAAGLAAAIEDAAARVELQNNSALTAALSGAELRKERQLAEWEREQERTRRRRQLAHTAGLEEQQRRTEARLARAEASDARWFQGAQSAAARSSSTAAKVAKLYRGATWTSRALIAVVLAGMAWAGVNVQQNLAPAGRLTDPLFWLSYGVEAMVSVTIVVVMVTYTTAGRHGQAPAKNGIIALELTLLAITLGLNSGTALSAGNWGVAAMHGVAPAMVGLVIWVHGWVAQTFAKLIASELEREGAREMRAPLVQDAHPSHEVRTPSAHPSHSAPETTPATASAGQPSHEMRTPRTQDAHPSHDVRAPLAPSAHPAGNSGDDASTANTDASASGVDAGQEGAHLVRAPRSAHSAQAAPIALRGEYAHSAAPAAHSEPETTPTATPSAHPSHEMRTPAAQPSRAPLAPSAHPRAFAAADPAGTVNGAHALAPSAHPTDDATALVAAEIARRGLVAKPVEDIGDVLRLQAEKASARVIQQTTGVHHATQKKIADSARDVRRLAVVPKAAQA